MRTRSKGVLVAVGALGVIATFIILGIVNDPRPPTMPDQIGNTPAEAYQAAEEAGYQSIDVRVGHPASKSSDQQPSSVEGTGGLKDGDVLADYAAWTVCVTESKHVGTGSGSWSVDFYLVKNASDCRDGKIPLARRREYERYAGEARIAANAALQEEEASHNAETSPTPDPVPDLDGASESESDLDRGSGSGIEESGTGGYRGSNPDYYDGNYENDDEWHERYGSPDEYYDGNYDNDDEYHDRYGRNSR
ncbi:hypothetical protein SUDANB58_04695 [Streptomyces sp. enrichment culture]